MPQPAASLMLQTRARRQSVTSHALPAQPTSVTFTCGSVGQREVCGGGCTGAYALMACQDVPHQANAQLRTYTPVLNELCLCTVCCCGHAVTLPCAYHMLADLRHLVPWVAELFVNVSGASAG